MKSKADASETPKNRSAAKKTKKLNSRADLKVYKSYFAAVGGLGFTFIYVLGLVTKQLLSLLMTWLLGRINSARPKVSLDQAEKPLLLIANVGNGLQHYLSLYPLISLLAITLEFLFNLHTFSGSIRASKALFREMTFRVIRMPILWLDTTPIGEMLKVSPADTKMVDDLVLATMSEFADCFVKLMIVFGVG